MCTTGWWKARVIGIAAVGMLAFAATACGIDTTDAGGAARGDDELVAGADSESDSDAQLDSALSASGNTYYSIRHDTRRCMWPLCGGYWVKRLNTTKTVCANGARANECYVVDINYDRTGLSDEQIANLGQGGQQVLYVGAMELHDYGWDRPLGQLVANEVWQAAGSATPIGTYYQVENNGIVCLTYPCFSYTETKLNNGAETTLSGLEGPEKLVAGAYEAMANGPVLATGSNRRVPREGPAGTGRHLVLTQFFTQVVPEPIVVDERSCNSDADCVLTGYTHTISSTDECYCVGCWSPALVNADTEEKNRASWEQYCSNVRLRCPAIACMMPPPYACIENRCSYLE